MNTERLLVRAFRPFPPSLNGYLFNGAYVTMVFRDAGHGGVFLPIISITFNSIYDAQQNLLRIDDSVARRLIRQVVGIFGLGEVVFKFEKLVDGSWLLQSYKGIERGLIRSWMDMVRAFAPTDPFNEQALQSLFYLD